MTKRELIDGIMEINNSATPDFLARFDNDDLHAYLESLHRIQTPRLRVDPNRFSGQFYVEQEATSPVAVAEPHDEEQIAETETDMEHFLSQYPVLSTVAESDSQQFVDQLESLKQDDSSWLF